MVFYHRITQLFHHRVHLLQRCEFFERGTVWLSFEVSIADGHIHQQPARAIIGAHRASVAFPGIFKVT